MKTQANRQQVQKLYVLGAGASLALSNIKTTSQKYARPSTPLDWDFLKRLKHFRPNSHTSWKRKSFKLLEDGWLDRADLIEHGLEQAIIKRVSQYDFLSTIHPRRTRDMADNATYLNHLSHLITDYLIACKSNQSGDTRRFINSVFPVGTDPSDYTNRIITFNYDTLIERPLLERGISKRKLYFDRIVAKQEDQTKRSSDERFSHPLILKLHGSINWRCSQADFEKIVQGDADPKSRITIWSDDTTCPKPDDSTSPLIIPPIPNKPITQASIFAHLWTTAYEYIHEAKELVIVGYSCPPTDTLARTMFTHFNAANLEKIVIVDPNAAALARYREMIPQLSTRKSSWQYFSGFSDYINAGDS